MERALGHAVTRFSSKAARPASAASVGQSGTSLSHSISVGFAPPYVVQGDQVLAQVCAISDFLGHHHLQEHTPYKRSLILQTGLTIADVVSEVHDTHHPLSTTLTYEEQADAALEAARLFREVRLPMWVGYFVGTSLP